MNPAPASKPAPTPVVAKKKSKTKWLIIGGVLLTALIVVGIVIKNKNQEIGIPVTTEKAVVKTITQLVTATGKVQPEVEVKISTEAPGEIIELPFKEGAIVKKGDLLVKIRPDTYQSQVEQQEANLVAAKATAVQGKSQLVKAQDDFKRVDDLFHKQLMSDSDFSAAKTNLEVGQANYDNALALNWFSLIPGVGTIGWGIPNEAGALEHISRPILRGANADLNMTLAMSMVFFACWIVWALQANGPGGFLLHLFAPKGEVQGIFMKTLMVIIFFCVGLLEIVSILFRPVSLSFRLLGNIFAGENMLETMTHLGGPYFGWLLPLPFYFMELLVGFVQALVFMLLTAVFTLLIMPHEEGQHH